MPYGGADDPSLPSYVKDLPHDKRKQWVAVWNSVYARCVSDGGEGSSCEAKAFKQANGVIKKERLHMSKLTDLMGRIKDLLVEAFGLEEEKEERAIITIKDVDTWDGSASQYGSTEEYCDACLIDMNKEAGRGSKKSQAYCKLPVRGPGDSVSTYVRQGVHGAAAALAGSRHHMAKPDGVSDADWEKAVKAAANKLIAVYGAMDETPPDSLYKAAGKSPPQRAISMPQMWEQLYLALESRNQATGGYAFPVDIYVDDGVLYAVVAEEGKLYRVELEIAGTTLVLGKWIEVAIIHVPTERMIVSRQADGSYRWVGISATAVLNRVGEIDSRDLFDAFVRRAAESGTYPKRDFFHLEEAGLVGQCDFLARIDNVLVTSGVYYDTPFAQAVRRATEAGFCAGDSISYLPAGEPELLEVQEGIRLPVYRDGTLHYISALPQNRAASLFTATTVREVKRMRQDVLEAIQRLKEFGLDDATIADIIEQSDNINRAIEELGLVTRGAANSAVSSAPATQEPSNAQPAPPVLELDDATLSEIARRASEGGAFRSVADRVAALEQQVTALAAAMEAAATRNDNEAQRVNERLVALERADADKQREWAADLPRARTRVIYRPSEARAAEPPADGSPAIDSDAIFRAAMAKVPGKPY